MADVNDKRRQRAGDVSCLNVQLPWHAKNQAGTDYSHDGKVDVWKTFVEKRERQYHTEECWEINALNEDKWWNYVAQRVLETWVRI